jgi:hypothetical protein
VQITQVIRRRKGLTAAVAITLLAAIGFGIYWFGPQALLFDRRVDEALPSAGTVPADDAGQSGGSFTGLAHETTGSARIVELDDGSFILRIDDLDTLDGPDLRVYLSTAPADGDEAAFGVDPIDLGGLKGNQGSQNYEIPTDVDIASMRSAVIWCRRFSVGFGVAPLGVPALDPAA